MCSEWHVRMYVCLCVCDRCYAAFRWARHCRPPHGSPAQGAFNPLATQRNNSVLR